MFRLCLCSALLSVIFVGCSKKKVADEQPTDDSADAVSTKTPAPEETTAVVDPLTITKTEVTKQDDLRVTLRVAEGVVTEAKCEVLAPPVADKAPMVDSSATGMMVMRLSCKEGKGQNYLTTEPYCHNFIDDIPCTEEEEEDCDCTYNCGSDIDDCPPNNVTVVNGVATLFSQDDDGYDVRQWVGPDGNCLRLHVTYDHDANPATAVKQVTGRVLLEEHDSL